MPALADRVRDDPVQSQHAQNDVTPDSCAFNRPYPPFPEPCRTEFRDLPASKFTYLTFSTPKTAQTVGGGEKVDHFGGKNGASELVTVWNKTAAIMRAEGQVFPGRGSSVWRREPDRIFL